MRVHALAGHPTTEVYELRIAVARWPDLAPRLSDGGPRSSCR